MMDSVEIFGYLRNYHLDCESIIVIMNKMKQILNWKHCLLEIITDGQAFDYRFDAK